MQVVTSLIALLVLAINFYLLSDFFLNSDVRGLATYITLALSAVLYVAFIVYLALQPSQDDGLWARLVKASSKYVSLLRTFPKENV